MSENKTVENKNDMPRPPVVAVLGHVDHGKTSLLDFIRKSSVADREAGGITQAVSAYEIEHASKKITFIDTPGHEAFMQMRSRGASIADVAILVVAAEEGVKPQTLESVRILKETNTPFAVAITKIDKPEGNIEKVKADLAGAEVLLEGYGGSISWHAVSAKTGEGVSELLDLILLIAEVEEFSYEPSAPASGFVLEARVTKQRGNEVVIILKNGVLRRGGSIATASASGKVKILEDFTGKQVPELRPSAPALVVGFESLPKVGEEFSEEMELMIPPEMELTVKEAVLPNAFTPRVNLINLIVNASDAGSLEAAIAILSNTPFDIPVRIVASSVGDIQDGDVQHAISTESVIVGFKTKVQKSAQFLTDTKKISIFTSDIIYRLVEAITNYRESLKAAISAELEVLVVFNKEKMQKQLVGGKVVRGQLKARQQFSVERNGEAVSRGRVHTLQQGKAETSSVPEGSECGAIVEAGVIIEVGDRLLVEQNAS